jgi:hypothetical protein
MSLSFPKAGDTDAVVGQTPWSARVPLNPLLVKSGSSKPSKPTRASAADQGGRPTASDRSGPALTTRLKAEAQNKSQ